VPGCGRRAPSWPRTSTRRRPAGSSPAARTPICSSSTRAASAWNLARFDHVELLPAARAYRRLLDELTLDRGWEIAATVTTLFLEGTKWERGEIDARAPKRPEPPLEQHPLVVHYGLPLAASR
jgi:hypothetical protein